MGVVGTDSVSLVTSSATGSFDDKNVGIAKTVTIAGLTLAGGNAGNYLLTQPTRTANITERPVTVNAVTDTKTYDGTTNSIGVPTLSAGTPLAPGDTEPAWTQSFDNRNVGTGKTLTPAGAVNDGNNGLNYVYTFAPNTSGEITTRAVTVTATADSKVYDGTTSSSGVPILSAGTPLVPGDIAPAWVQAFDTKNVGTAKSLTPAGSVVDGNGGLNYIYNFIPATTGVITPAPLTITANPRSKSYGQTVAFAGTEFTPAGLVSGDTVSSVTLTSSGALATASVAGSPYTIVPSAATGTGLGNYSISYVDDSLTLNPATLTITANDRAKTYGQTVTFTGTEFTSTGLVNADTVSTVTLTSSGAAATAAVAGSPYTIVPSAATGTGLGNYSISYVDGSLTLNPAALTITANDHAKTYGQTVTFAGTEFTPTGLVNADTVSSVTLTSSGAAATASVAGSPYPIVPSAATGTGLGNYSISYVDGSLTLNPAPLLVTALDASRLYGQANPAFSASYSGFVNGETNTVLGGTLLLTTIADIKSPVGRYPITASGLTATNYSFTYANGTLTITAPAPTILSLAVASPTDVMITWSAVSNGIYRIQYLPVLGTTNWADLIGDITATDNTASKNDTRISTNRFYRVQVVP